MSTALVLSGGGARGAYQAGVLLGLKELGVVSSQKQPFDILIGTSAGSLNCTMWAAYADDPEEGLREMQQVWSRLRASQVFRTDAWSVISNAVGWVRDLSLGGLIGRVSPRALLDTAPLKRLLTSLPWARLRWNLEQQRYRALGILATNYTTSNGVLFLQDRTDIPAWTRVRYRVERGWIGKEHLMASSAIPVIFPAIPLGGCFYGDGSLRNTAPLGPAIQLGARKIVAVGVREGAEMGVPLGGGIQPPKLADVAGVLLDAVLLDAIEVDVQHCLRLNKLAMQGDSFRPIEVLWLRPSQRLASLAQQLERRIPPAGRYLLRGRGDDEATAELASSLNF